MLKQISASLLIFFSGLSVFAQTEKYNAPVKWERYKVAENEVSVLLPKLPILISADDICRGEETKKYTAYAENAVYGLNITFNTKRRVEDFVCRENKKFDERNFNDRLKQLKTELKDSKETRSIQNESEVIKIENEFFAYWLINDFTNKRWFELWSTNTNETNVRIKNFIQSLKIEKNPTGIEMAKGSPRTLGDEMTGDKTASLADEKKQTNNDIEAVSVRIIIKPRASYTDAARQAQFQGKVRLRVTFLASGGIGSISVADSSEYGLTEQAIAAASKMVFIPARRNNINLTVTKLVEYSFTLY